jgi:hypothetical protein
MSVTMDALGIVRVRYQYQHLDTMKTRALENRYADRFLVVQARGYIRILWNGAATANQEPGM